MTKRTNGFRQSEIKRILSFCMALAILLTLLPAGLLSIQAEAATTKTVTVYFSNSAGWSQVNGYVWNSAEQQLLGQWPGTKLSADSNGLYKLSINIDPAAGFNFIFNDGGSNQTADLSLTKAQIESDQIWCVNATGKPAKYAPPVISNGNVTFTYESSSASSVYLAGTMTEWSQVKMTENNNVFTYTTKLQPGTYEYKFVVNGSDWISDPCNPNVVGNDGNSLLVVTGLFDGSAVAVKGQASKLPSELNYLDASGNTVKRAVTYSVGAAHSSYVTLSGNKITVSESFAGTSLELTATAADGSTAIVTLSLRNSGDEISDTVRIHFYNAPGWSGVCGFAWGISGSTTNSVSGLEWPGTLLQRDADGYYTLTLDYVPTAGEDLGVLFHNHNGGQTADVKISYNKLITGSDFWVEPSLTADDSGKYPCTLYTAESSVFKSYSVSGNQVTFRYKGSASSVYLAGSFNGWSKTANKMTKGSNGIYSCTVNLSAGIYEYKLIVNGEWVTDPANGVVSGYDGNSIAVIPGTDKPEENKVTIKFHYYREDGKYTDWDLWTWGAGFANGKAVAFEADTVNKGVVATFTVDGVANKSVGYKVRKTDWSAEDKNYDRYIDLSDVTAGTVHYYLVSGADVANRVLEHNVVSGGKIVSASLAYDTGRIWVHTSVPLSGALSNAFSVVDKNGKTVTGVTVTSVGQENGEYVLTLSKKLTLGELASYQIKCGGFSVEIKAENLFYSKQFRQDYHYKGDDLGAVWSKESTTFKVWAPTAKKVQLKRYKGGNYGGNDSLGTVDMVMGEQGVWSVTVQGDLHGTYYNYLVTHPTYTVEAVDPYAASTGANGDRGMILNMDATDPDGWDKDVSPNQGMKYTDAIIYEMHVREFTIDSSSGVDKAYRGTYLGLTQTGTSYNGYATGLDHLKELGITHVQLMPVFDFKAIDEYHTTDWDQYEWGYDPKHFYVPEGGYSTNPFDGSVRVNEFKQMVQTFHSNGINVIMDVVFNHTFAGADFCYNQIVPNYFSRFFGDTWSNGSGCGNDVATEREMARKYLVDTVMHWVEEYHVDGFRFDLVGLIDTQTMNEIVNTVHAKYPYVMFYGEGWTVGDTAIEDGYTLSLKENAWMTPGLGFFNDNFRNDIAGNNGNAWGFTVGDTGKADAIANYFRASNGWSTSPTQTINYVSCHDNYCLMDKIIIARGDATWANQVKMHNLSAAIYMMAQGTPFMYSGEEVLREKKDASGNRYDNAYGTDDYINKIRWSDLKNKSQAAVTNDYYAGLIAFRKNHAALRSPNGSDAWGNVKYHKINNQTILFYIGGNANNECSDGIVIIYNASTSTQWVNLYNYGIPAGKWQACVHGQEAGTEALWTVDVTGSSGRVGVEGISTTILVLGDLEDENSIYSKQDAYIACSHPKHSQDGICTKCGEKVNHRYVDGTCSCGLVEYVPETVTIYFDNSKTKWSKVNIYAWTTSGSTTNYTGNWPGTAMTLVGDNIYAFTLSGKADNVIFNNGSSQTADLTIPSYSSGLNMYDSNTQNWTTYEGAALLTITKQPVNASAYNNKTAKVTVEAQGDGLTYQWYYKNAGASKFTLTTSFTGNSYSISMSDARDGRQVYCVITDKYGNSVKSDTVTLSLRTWMSITKQPVNVSAYTNKTAKVTVGVKGDGLTYKWYWAAPGSDKFSLTTSFKGSSYSISMTEARDGRRVYCVITDAYGRSVKTNTVTLSLRTWMSITKQPVNVSAYNGKTAKVTVGVKGDGLTYKWYWAAPGSDKFTLTTSFKGNSYSISMTSARSGRRVYCVITDAYGRSVKTDIVTLTQRTWMSITKQPVSVTVASGKTAKVTVGVKGDGLTYKWYWAAPGSDKFTLTTSFKGNAYSISMNAARSGRRVYCVITDAYGRSVKTDVVTLKMK